MVIDARLEVMKDEAMTFQGHEDLMAIFTDFDSILFKKDINQKESYTTIVVEVVREDDAKSVLHKQRIRH